MSFSGQLLAIYLTSTHGAPLQPVEGAEALAGGGLAGDRYAVPKHGEAVKPLNQLTLIESEALEAATRDYQLTLDPAQTRRNLLTAGVPLNHLVGREFTVGEVRLRGIELCEPCGHLEKLTLPGVQKAFKHRGGLRAEIVAGGNLRVGDAIQVVG